MFNQFFVYYRIMLRTIVTLEGNHSYYLQLQSQLLVHQNTCYAKIHCGASVILHFIVYRQDIEIWKPKFMINLDFMGNIDVNFLFIILIKTLTLNPILFVIHFKENIIPFS